MALSDEVTNRVAAKILRGLTNPDNSNATTIDATYLDRACDDVESFFQIYAQITYDNSDRRHIVTAIEGVTTLLTEWANQAGPFMSERFDLWVTRLKALAAVTSRKRVTPVSTSQVTVTDEQEDAETVRPDFDRSRFRDIVPDAPGGEDNESGAV